MEGPANLRIVLLGKTGTGKSSTAYSLLGEKFKTSCHANSDTATCKAASKTVDERKITVIDTPGYFCTECPDEEIKPEIAKCIIECSPGPHAFIIVLTVGRQTPEEKKAVDDIMKTFGEGALKYAIVLFTHGDQLDDNVTIQEFVDNNDHLKTLVQKCGNRLHVIDNKYWNNPTNGHGHERSNTVQIQKLLNTIDQMVEQNGGKHYTNEMLQSVDQAIVNEMAAGKTREKAKQSVMKRFLIVVAGIKAGSLCRALLDLARCAGAVAGSTAILIAQAMKSPAAVATAANRIQPVATVANRVQPVATVANRAQAVAAEASKVRKRLGAGVRVGTCAGAIAGGVIGANAPTKLRL